jgi:hypothetical protein
MALTQEEIDGKRRAALVFGLEEGLTMVEIGLAIYQGSGLANRNHIGFFTLISNGLERIMKIVLVLHAIETTNSTLTEKQLKKELGHGINRLKEDIITKCFSPDYLKQGIAVADLSFLQNDTKLNAILDILDDFAVTHRYFYLNAVLEPEKFDLDMPKSKWWGLEGDLLDTRWFDTTNAKRLELKQENIRDMIIPIEKFVRALTRLLAYGSVGSEGKAIAVFANRFSMLKDSELGNIKRKLDPIM